MAVKILIQRKVKPGKEKELKRDCEGASLQGHLCRKAIFPERPCAPLKTLPSPPGD